MDIEALRAAPPAKLTIPVVRSVAPSQGVELRADAEGGMPTMAGYFSVFNVWYQVDSWVEGRFMERVVPGAFAPTLDGRARDIVSLFDHGMDPTIGNKVLGPFDELEEDRIGGRYAVPLLDTSYNRDLLPGLQAGLYGSSFRFSVRDDEWNRKAKASDANPEGLPERTITSTEVYELGPVTFPANPAARSGIRSDSDRFYTFLQRSDPETFGDAMASVRSARPTPPTPARRLSIPIATARGAARAFAEVTR